MHKWKLILVSSIGGFVVLLAWTTVILLAPNAAGQLFLSTGMLLLPILGPIIPNKVSYFLFPEGGLNATVGFAFLVAAMLWWLLGTLGAYLVLHIRSCRKR